MALGLLACRHPVAARSIQGSRCAHAAAPRALHFSVTQRRSGLARLPVQQPRQQQRHHTSGCSAAPVTVAAAAASASAGEPLRPAWGPVQLLARAVALVVSMWRSVLTRLAQGATPWQPLDAEAVNAQIKGGVRNMRTLMAVAPFAAISSSSVHTLMLITRAVSSFIKLYLLLLFMRVLLSWFPAFNWEDQPWLALRQVTDPYLNLFRGLVPPLLGTIDFTPLFGFMILQFLAGVLEIQDEDSDVW